MNDPKDFIPDHDLNEPDNDFNQDSFDDNEQAKEDLAMDER